MNAAEQTHMTKIIEKKQVSPSQRYPLPQALLKYMPAAPDARLYAHVLQPRREVFQRLLQRLHEQGPFLKGGTLPAPFSACI